MVQDSLPVFVFGCVVCGKTVAGTEKGCPRCGASFETVKFECPFCGELTSPAGNRCEACGTEFTVFAEEVLETSSIDLDGEVERPGEHEAAGPVEYECPSCGKPVGKGDTKCPHCGASFTDE